MGKTSETWEVTGAVTATTSMTAGTTVTGGTGLVATTGSVSATAGHIYANGGDLVARDYIRMGVTGGYLTDGNYNWAVSDGNGVKMQMVTLLDAASNGALYRLYVQNGNVRAMPI